MSDTVQTDYARAAAGFDEQFRDALMAEIIGTVAECSVLTDAPLLAIRTGETADALVRCLIAVLAMSPQMDNPRELREHATLIAKRIRREVAKARANPTFACEFFGARQEGTA
jgi:hypothetical protein